MENMIDPAVLNGNTYLLVSRGIVEGIGHAFLLMTGYARQDFYQKDISEVLHTLFKYDCDPEKNPSSESYLFKRNNEVVEVHVHICEVDASRKLYLFRQKENFILHSELSLIHQLLKDNHLGVGVFCRDGFRLLRANQKYQEYIKDVFHTEHGVIGLSLHDFVPDYCGSEAERQMQNICSTGKTLRMKACKVILADSVRYWNQSIIPITEGENVRFIIMVLEDVTDFMVKNEQIEKKNEELRKTIEMKDEILALITHELKTPLSVISSSVQAVEVICQNELSEKVIKYLNKIKQNTYRQMKLVNNILDNSRATSGLFRMNRSNIDIVDLTKIIVEMISVFAERKQLKISFSSKVKQSFINADVDIYERILLNLLSNAVKFTPEGETIAVRIAPVAGQGRPRISIQVQDNGIGIPEDKKDQIFERFGRADRLASRHSEGTGIGLYLVNTLVTLLDGEIRVESTENKGSTFTLIFPTVKNGTWQPSGAFEFSGDRLLHASNVEFSDIYYGA